MHYLHRERREGGKEGGRERERGRENLQETQNNPATSFLKYAIKSPKLWYPRKKSLHSPKNGNELKIIMGGNIL